MQKPFRMLRIFAHVLQGIAILLGCFFLVFPCASIFMNPLTTSPMSIQRGDSFFAVVLAVTFPGLLGALGFYIGGEMILLLLAIEENTRAAAELLQRRRRPSPEIPKE